MGMINKPKKTYGKILCFLLLLLISSQTNAQLNSPSVKPQKSLKVAVAGTAPFVVDTVNGTGISLELWQDLASRLNWDYTITYYNDVPAALHALELKQADIVVGPISISSQRVKKFLFTQPYFQSSLSILSNATPPTLWERIGPFFSTKFFIAVLIFLFILTCVGTLLWLAERERNTEQFPKDFSSGIGNGMWLAIVTMSTTGYGDRAPVTFWGRIIAGSWMVVSIIFATTMVAGIASTLTLTGINKSTIEKAEALNGRNVAVVQGTPAAIFSRHYGAKNVNVHTLEQGYDLLKRKKVDALVYDKPQLQFMLKNNNDLDVHLSLGSYDEVGYGFAMNLDSKLLHSINIALLLSEESGHSKLIIDSWLKQ